MTAAQQPLPRGRTGVRLDQTWLHSSWGLRLGSNTKCAVSCSSPTTPTATEHSALFSCFRSASCMSVNSTSRDPCHCWAVLTVWIYHSYLLLLSILQRVLLPLSLSESYICSRNHVIIVPSHAVLFPSLFSGVCHLYYIGSIEPYLKQLTVFHWHDRKHCFNVHFFGC